MSLKKYALSYLCKRNTSRTILNLKDLAPLLSAPVLYSFKTCQHFHLYGEIILNQKFKLISLLKTTTIGFMKLVFFILFLLGLSTVSYSKTCYPDSRSLPAYKNNKNFLSFENFGFRGIGRCRGHAIITQKMEMLSKFNVSAHHPCINQDEVACEKIIYDLVTTILSGQVAEIGGFDSLYEFSKDPVAKTILRNKVLSVPHRYQAEDSPLEVNQFPIPNLNVFHDLLRRIKLNHRPYISVRGTIRISAHALLGYKTGELNGAPYICVRDPNVVINDEPFENCQNYIYVLNDNIYYHQEGFKAEEKLFEITIKTDEDQRIQDYTQAHYEWCINKNP